MNVNIFNKPIFLMIVSALVVVFATTFAPQPVNAQTCYGIIMNMFRAEDLDGNFLWSSDYVNNYRGIPAFWDEAGEQWVFPDRSVKNYIILHGPEGNSGRIEATADGQLEWRQLDGTVTVGQGIVIYEDGMFLKLYYDGAICMEGITTQGYRLTGG